MVWIPSCTNNAAWWKETVRGIIYKWRLPSSVLTHLKMDYCISQAADGFSSSLWPSLCLFILPAFLPLCFCRHLVLWQVDASFTCRCHGGVPVLINCTSGDRMNHHHLSVSFHKANWRCFSFFPHIPTTSLCHSWKRVSFSIVLPTWPLEKHGGILTDLL